MRRKSLVDLLRRDLQRDPGDAPAVYVEANVAAQDMEWMPSAEGPEPVDYGRHSSRYPGTSA